LSGWLREVTDQTDKFAGWEVWIVENSGSPDRIVGTNTDDALRERWRPSDALASGADGGCLAAPGSPGAKRSATGPADPWTLLAREAEGLLVVLQRLSQQLGWPEVLPPPQNRQ